MLRVLEVETSSLRSVPCSRFAKPWDRAAQISLRLCWRTLGQRRRRPGSLSLCVRCSPTTGNDVVVKQGRVLTLRNDAPRVRPVAQALQARMTKEKRLAGLLAHQKRLARSRNRVSSAPAATPTEHSQNDMAVLRRRPDITPSASVADADTTLLSSLRPGIGGTRREMLQTALPNVTRSSFQRVGGGKGYRYGPGSGVARYQANNMELVALIVPVCWQRRRGGSSCWKCVCTHLLKTRQGKTPLSRCVSSRVFVDVVIDSCCLIRRLLERCPRTR